MSFSEFQKYKDDILKFIDDIDGLEKEIAERFKVLKFFNHQVASTHFSWKISLNQILIKRCYQF